MQNVRPRVVKLHLQLGVSNQLEVGHKKEMHMALSLEVLLYVILGLSVQYHHSPKKTIATWPRRCLIIVALDYLDDVTDFTASRAN